MALLAVYTEWDSHAYVSPLLFHSSPILPIFLDKEIEADALGDSIAKGGTETRALGLIFLEYHVGFLLEFLLFPDNCF